MRSEMRSLLRLSFPLILGYAGNQLMSFVDAAMVGRLGSEAALSAINIGNGIFFSLTVLGMGCVLGMDAMVAQAVGAREEARARRILWQGVRIAAVASIPLTLLTLASPLILPWFDVVPTTVDEVARYLTGRFPNITFFLLFAATRSYLQAKSTTGPIVIAMLVANVVNLVGNVVFIFGDKALERIGLPPIGLPELGVMGSGIASSLASAASFLVLVRAIAVLPTPADPERRKWRTDLSRTIFRLGIPVGLQLLAEVGVFALVGILAGRNEQAGSGHMVAISLASITFTVSLGIASATSVRVGLRIGGGDTIGARRAGIVGLLVAASFMSLSAAVFLAAPSLLARILSDSPRVIAAATPLILIAAVFQLSDGAQVVAAGALRGAGDTHVPLYVNLVGHYAVGLPVAIVLGFVVNMGARGLWWGLSAGLTFVALALCFRFFALTSRHIERI